LLNGIAAIALLVGIAHSTADAESTQRFADAMMVFGVGAVLGLAAAFLAYLNRTFRMERPPWLAIGAAILGAACFLTGLNMARIASHHTEVRAAIPSAASPQSSPSSPTKP